MVGSSGTLRLPSPSVAVAIYAVITFISVVPMLFLPSIGIGMLRYESFLAASLLISPAVFIAALSINHPSAFLVPLAGGLFTALATYYALTKMGPYGRDFAPVTDGDFHAGLWRTFRYSTIPHLLATGLGLLAADRMVETVSGSPSRLRLPASKPTTTWAIAALTLMTTTAIVQLEFGGRSEVLSMVFSLLVIPGSIAIFVAPAILFREAAVWLVVFPVAAEYYWREKVGLCDFSSVPGDSAPCWPSFQPEVILRTLLAYTIVIGLAYGAGWWGRRPKAQDSSGISSESVTAST